MFDVADSDLNFVCLFSFKQDCVTINPPDTVLLRPPTLSLLPRLSIDKSLPQVGQHFQFSKVGVSPTDYSKVIEMTGVVMEGF